jgi:hypothetical protein
MVEEPCHMIEICAVWIGDGSEDRIRSLTPLAVPLTKGKVLWSANWRDRRMVGAIVVEELGQPSVHTIA